VTGMALLAGLACVAAAGEGDEGWPPGGDLEWTCEYAADVLPEQAAPLWAAYNGLETEASVDDGVLRIVDASSEKGSMRSYRHTRRIDAEQGAVVEARIQLVANDDFTGTHVMLADGVHEAILTVCPDRVAVNRDGPTYTMTTTDDFHVYRMAVRKDDVLVWVDGQLVVDGKGAHTRPAHAGRNQVSFGAGASVAQSEALWDYVRYAVLGELETPEVVAGAQHVVIYKRKDVYACFPSLVQSEDGTLATGFGTRVRRSHIDPTGGSATYLSKDNGRTWEEAPKGYRIIEPSWRCPDGSLVRAGAYGWRQVPAERRAEFEDKAITVRDVRPGVVAYLQGACVRRSTDGGETWQREELELPKHKSLMNYTRAERCTLASGVRLAAPYGALPDDELGRSFILRSEDHGKTWTFDTLAVDPEGKVRLNETALAENDRGEVIAMIRSEPPAGGHLYQSITTDEGRTWSPPKRTDVWGYPAHLLRLHDGRMLCCYGYRRDAMGIRAVLSSDGGHTWDTEHTIVLRADGWGNGGDLGYPISVETAPGEVFTIYYITNEDGITHVAGTIWQPPAA